MLRNGATGTHDAFSTLDFERTLGFASDSLAVGQTSGGKIRHVTPAKDPGVASLRTSYLHMIPGVDTARAIHPECNAPSAFARPTARQAGSSSDNRQDVNP
jgi:hypothetical protein